jgi:hypothetical protein
MKFILEPKIGALGEATPRFDTFLSSPILAAADVKGRMKITSKEQIVAIIHTVVLDNLEEVMKKLKRVSKRKDESA